MIITSGLGVGGGLASRGYGAWTTSTAPTIAQGIGRSGGGEHPRLAHVVAARSADAEAARRMAAGRLRPAQIDQARLVIVAGTRHTDIASARPAGRISKRRNTQGSTR